MSVWLTWHWTPGSGGLVAEVPQPAIAQVPLPPTCPPGTAAVRPLHLTALRRASMAPLEDVLGPNAQHWLSLLPSLALPTFSPTVHEAVRPPHPTKDPADCTIPRRTGFLVPRDQATLHATLAAVVVALERASLKAGGPAFPHPEPERFFHLSVWNNRGGDAWRSIGDIHEGDTAARRLGQPSSRTPQ